MAAGGAVHVRRLQLHLAGGDGCVELHLSSVHDVEHQADADDDLRRAERRKWVQHGNSFWSVIMWSPFYPERLFKMLFPNESTT